MSTEAVTSTLVVEVVLNDAARAAGIEAPRYAQPGDAGADLCTTEDVVLAPGERKLVPTGVSIALPFGFAGFIHPRSGLAAKKGLTVVNSPGTIDAGYRGELKVCLLNTDATQPIELGVGDRIAQLVIQRVETAAFQAVEELSASVRGGNGFGSTGGFIDPTSEPSWPEPIEELPILEQAPRLTRVITERSPIGVRTAEIIGDALVLALVSLAFEKTGAPQVSCCKAEAVVMRALGWLAIVAPDAAPADPSLTVADAVRLAIEPSTARDAFELLSAAKAGPVGFEAAINRLRHLLEDRNEARAVFEAAGASSWLATEGAAA